MMVLPREASWTAGASSSKEEGLSLPGAPAIQSFRAAGSHIKSVRQSSRLRVPRMAITATIRSGKGDGGRDKQRGSAATAAERQ